MAEQHRPGATALIRTGMISMFNLYKRVVRDKENRPLAVTRPAS